MKNFFIILNIFACVSVFAQSKFESGYYIDNSGTKFIGEISEINPNVFPSEFYFKNENGETKIQTNTVKELKYGVLLLEKKQFKFDPTIRFEIQNLNSEREFNLVNAYDFVELLVDGDFKLYRYKKNGVSTFLYQNLNGDLVPLLYKKYVTQRTTIIENSEFKKQLWREVKNEKYTSFDRYTYLKYRADDLEDYFKEANGISFKREKKGQVIFNLYAGYSMHTMDISFLSDLPAKTHQGLTIMPEIECLYNRNVKNPVGFYVSAKLHSFKENFVEPYERYNWNHKVDYQSIFVTLGVKKYFMSTKKVQPFAKFGFAINNPIKGKIESPVDSWRLNLIVLERYSGGFNSGVGVKLYNKFLLEVDYDFAFKTAYIDKNTALNLKVGYSF